MPGQYIADGFDPYQRRILREEALRLLEKYPEKADAIRFTFAQFLRYPLTPIEDEAA